ncbi:MAG TPA: DMT family transporter [Candidatus Woesebacteria bacterium]|nr:DMT family transporter [Candidatus Woesebacteria bacterium]
MNWIIASLLMFLSSVALYLGVRKSNTLKTPQQLNNLAMFLIPLLVYLVLTVKTPTSFALKPFEYLLILIQGIFFSYLGNTFSLKGIEYSPNPGYSLIISKSYVVFTAIASVFIFSAPLTIKSAIAIALIVLFSALITIEKNKNRTTSNKSWLPYTIGAFFCWGFLALSSKYLLNMGVPILTRLILSMVVVTVIIFGEIIFKKIAWKKVSKEQLITLLLIGIFGSSFNYYMQVAFNLAPNVGFVNATNAASISLLTLMSAFFFNDELTVKKTIGIFGVTAGLLLLFL